MMRVSVVTPPAAYPVSLAEAKTHLAIPATETEHDGMISALIGAASEVCEQITNRKFITQTVELYFERFPFERWFELPFGGLQSVVSIGYVDEDGAPAVFSSAEYQTDNAGVLGIVQLKEDSDWPDTAKETLRAVTIRFTCGYGDAAAVPKAIKQAILMYVGTFYENRESIIAGTIVAKTPDTVELLLQSHRIFYFQ
jgi:uncharacterized phiE125 gp8 family phage protein